jgi:Flp pilus assembly protein TadG
MRLLRGFRKRLYGRGSDRGASAVELAILAPALLFVSLMIVQFALWLDATHAALAAAQEGDRAARETAFTSSVNGTISANGPWVSSAQDIAMKYYAGLDTSVLSGVSAAARPGQGNTVSVTVSGNLISVIPLPFQLKVSETATGPVECLRATADGGVNCVAPAAG